MASSALFLNFYTTTLSASISSTATTMSVSSTTGLPSSLASGQFIPMILTSAAAPGTVYEIVYVTGISGSSLTITRGQEGTSALNWNASDIVYSNNTAQTTAPNFPSGTRLLFQQSTVPPGWTQDTTVQNDSLLRMVNGSTVGTYAGNGVSVVLRGGESTDGTALNGSQVPNHTHTMQDHQHETPVGTQSGNAGNSVTPNQSTSPFGTGGTYSMSGRTAGTNQGTYDVVTWLSNSMYGGAGQTSEMNNETTPSAHTHTLSSLNVNSIDVIVGVKN